MTVKDAKPSTLSNFRHLIDRDGELRIAWPDGHLSRDDRAVGLVAAA